MDDSNSRTFARGYFFSLADYQNHSHFANLRVLISSPAVSTKLWTQNLWEMGTFPKLNVHYSSNQKGEFCIYTENRKAIRKYVTKLSSFRLIRSASHKLFIQQLFSLLSVLKKDYHFKLLLFLNWKVTDTDVFVDKLPNTNGTWLYEIIRIININFFLWLSWCFN